MSILMVDNCPGCGKVYQKNMRNLCMNCVQELNSEFDACYNYLRYNRKATTEQLCHATGVPAQRVFAWIKDKRLAVTDYPNLTYLCNSCRIPIQHENLCYSCRIRLSGEIRELQHKETLRTQRSGFHSRLQRN